MYKRGLSKQQIMTFCLDAIEFDSVQNKLVVSFESLLKSMTTRRALEAQFIETGGRYIRQLDQAQKTHAEGESQLKRTLLVSQEKDLADSKVDIKVFLCHMDSMPGLNKVQVEIFTVEEPSLVYRCDFLTSTEEIGK